MWSIFVFIFDARSPATFPEAGRRSPSGAASPTLGYRSYSPSFARNASSLPRRPETASRPTAGGTASRLGQAVLALTAVANIDADELEIRNLRWLFLKIILFKWVGLFSKKFKFCSSIQSNASRMDKREQVSEFFQMLDLRIKDFLAFWTLKTISICCSNIKYSLLLFITMFWLPFCLNLLGNAAENSKTFFSR